LYPFRLFLAIWPEGPILSLLDSVCLWFASSFVVGNPIWKFFTRLTDLDKAECHICGKRQTYKVTSSSSDLVRHLRHKHPWEYMELQKAKRIAFKNSASCALLEFLTSPWSPCSLNAHNILIAMDGGYFTLLMFIWYTFIIIIYYFIYVYKIIEYLIFDPSYKGLLNLKFLRSCNSVYTFYFELFFLLLSGPCFGNFQLGTHTKNLFCVNCVQKIEKTSHVQIKLFNT